jgi:hypothetical protein
MKKLFYSVFAIAFMASIFSSCEDVPAPFDDPNTNKQDTTVIEDGSYLNETFEKDFGKFTVKTVKGTDWIYTSYNNKGYAKATGYVSQTQTVPSESYLISPTIDLSKAKSAHLSFDYALRYLKNGAVDKVYITDNYTGNPTTTTWTDITGTLTEGSDWTFISFSQTIPTTFIGKNKVVIAFYYSCTSANSSTWEIKNVKIQDGEATNDSGSDTGGSTDVAASGDGTQASPYNVTAAIAKATATNSWVKGYIVGYVNGMTLSSGAVFSADTCTVKTNLLIAASATETDVKKCMPVQLPSGTVRDGLNLSDHKGYYKKEVTLYGAIASYFSAPGVKSVTYAEIDGNKIGTDPSSTPVTTGLLNETFASSQGNFTIVDVKLPSDLKYLWKEDTSYKCMKASAYYNKKNYESESWLISPAIDMSKVSDATLSFDQACKYFNDISKEVSIRISTDYSTGDPTKATWTTLTISTWPAADFKFITNSVNIKNFCGKNNVHIAFQYTSTSSAAGTWEIKNVTIK